MLSSEILPELQKRWKTLQNEMQKQGADGCLIGVNVNLYYLTDRVFIGYLYIPLHGEPCMFVKRPIGISGDNVHYIRKPEQIVETLHDLKISLPKALLLELDELPYNDILRLQSVFQPALLLNATTLMRQIRSIKSSYEIELLRYSGQLHADCYSRVPELYQKGMTDLDLSIEIERLFRKQGATGYFRVFGQSMEIFMGSVIAGNNADNASPYDFAMGGGGTHKSLPVSANGTEISEGCTVMVDMGGTFTGYISDMTRVFSVGKVNDLAYKAHQVALEIQSDIEAVAQPGIALAELYNLAVAKVNKNNLLPYFMGHTQQAGFIGHGIGIQINELPVLAPRSKEILQVGHVFALEPKFVIPSVGAVGIENSFAVHQSGVEKLTILNEAIIELK